MPPPLNSRTRQLVEAIFSRKDVEEVVRWLEEECGNNISGCEKSDAAGMERIRFAVLKLSEGNTAKLLGAIDDARMDWRDLFMAAGFGFDVNEHQRWADEISEPT